MSFLTKRKLSRLKYRVRELLRPDQSILMWCEDVVDHAFAEYHGKIPVDLTFLANKWNVEIENVSNLRVPAKLTIFQNKIVISLKYHVAGEKLKSNRDIKLELSHELAHLFLYDLSSSPAKKKITYNRGDPEIEFIVDMLSHRVLLPRSILNDTFKNNVLLNGVNEPLEYNYKGLAHLASAFEISEDFLLTRCIIHTGIWNIAIFRFVKLIKQDDYNWRLIDRYYPQHLYVMKNYIPQQDVNKSRTNPKRYPSAKNQLHNFLNDCFENQLIHTTYRTKIEKLNSPPLSKFIDQIYNLNDILVYRLAKRVTPKSNYELVLFIPISNKF